MARPRPFLPLTATRTAVDVVRTASDLSSSARGWQRDGFVVGVVPTMGALHEGHASLIRRSRETTDRVVVTIFVNPKQFNDQRDFESYPDTWEADRRLCAELGVDTIYHPGVDEMYPPGFRSSVHVSGLTERWEGADRPGHFDGVTTVVTKLLVASGADVAFFGQKDFQQAAVVRRMVLDLDIPVRIEVCSTGRDHDGLALSSRNRRLDASSRRRAVAIPRSLEAVQEAFASGIHDGESLATVGREVLNANDLEIHYVAVVDPVTLEPVERAVVGSVLLVAATCAGVRLIDNHVLA